VENVQRGNLLFQDALVCSVFSNNKRHRSRAPEAGRGRMRSVLRCTIKQLFPEEPLARVAISPLAIANVR